VNTMRSIYPFDHAHTEADTVLRKCLGSKGFSLWLMTHELGLPVPPGFTIGTDECHAFFQRGFDPELEIAIRSALDNVATRLERRYGDPAAPLLVSVRSGAAASMPGMMDTLLNVGMTPAIMESLATATQNPIFARESYLRFLTSFASIVLGQGAATDPAEFGDVARLDAAIRARREHISAFISLGELDDPWQQLLAATRAVFQSWNSPRAISYRARAQMEATGGTAINVQAMVFGNQDERSGTGVAFTRNPSTGDPAPCGDFLFRAQGEDVVGGSRRTLTLDAFEKAMPDAYGELVEAMDRLERYYRDLCDIEFTIERGKLWMLQARVGKRSPLAAPRIAVDLVREGKVGLGREEAVSRIDPDLLSGASHIERAVTEKTPIALGIGVSPGSASGKIVFDPDRAVELAELGEDVILVRQETSPEDVHGMGVAKGILTTQGGMMSHAAVVARAWGIPAVCSAAGVEFGGGVLTCGGKIFGEGDVLSIDGDTGAVYLGQIGSKANCDPYLAILRNWASEQTGQARA
jgi:pyruvate,orthophosphate dikinase